ncbi:MAG: hypothetical protein JKY94_10005 [Rhodobacteraceae bacterium]|nr:hypothetical protein [Paracoccaceae bacterium]
MERRAFLTAGAATIPLSALPFASAASAMSEAEGQRLIDTLIALADRTGLSMDVWHDWTQGLELSAIEQILVNAEDFAELAQAAPADPHLAWLQQWYQARVEWIVAAGNDNADTPESEEVTVHEHALANKIINTKAQTQEGINAQVEFLIADQLSYLRGEYGLDFIQSLSAWSGAAALVGPV